MYPLLQAPLRWFNLHPGWRRLAVPVWGSLLHARTADRWLALQLHRCGLMGAGDRDFLTAHVKPGMTVLDIGANQGLYSLLLARLVGPAGQVAAFEPDDLLYESLQQNVLANGAETIRTHHLALGSQPGNMTLHRSLLNSGDNRLSKQAETAGPREAVQIQIERPDAVLAGRKVDFIKMDVQGWEFEVLRGMSGLLADPQNDRLAIYFEFWPQGLRDAGSNPLEPLEFLAAHGFRLYRPEDTNPGSEKKNFSSLTQITGYTNLYALRSQPSTG